MEASTTWKKEHGLKFYSELGTHTVPMDAKAPIGRGEAPTPKQLLLAAITGCTGMDVIAHLKKVREVPDYMEIKISTQDSTSHPVIFQKVHLTYSLKSSGSPEAILEAINKSMTQYCGVSAMISKVSPISYEVHLNDQHIGQGVASFSI
jgi:putative redox protein